MTEAFNTINVRPIAAALGVEIDGVDLAAGPDEAQFDEIRRAYHQCGVIFFRDQTLTPEQHIAFAERWGSININRFFATKSFINRVVIIGAELTNFWSKIGLGRNE
ncbi:MAG: TauD/TfdA family dioxygenase [Alphaproteobacteria bacterium]